MQGNDMHGQRENAKYVTLPVWEGADDGLHQGTQQ